MKQTLGNRIAEKRRAKGMTQDELAEKLGISAQAVSKWENDVSCPDISLLPPLAALLGCTVDALLTGEQAPDVKLVPEQQRKAPDDLMMRILVHSQDGDFVKVNLPLPLVKMGFLMGMEVPKVNGKHVTENLDMNQLMRMIDSGLVGKLMEIETSDGDTVEIVVE